MNALLEIVRRFDKLNKQIGLLGYIERLKMAVTVLLALGCFKVFAEVETVGGVQWHYTVSNGKASVYNSTQAPAISSETVGAVTVPTTLGGCPVTSIGLGAFRACNHLTTVTVQTGVTTISAEAFYDCRELSSVKLPEGVTQIGTRAFAHGSKLKSVNMPDSVKSIGEYAFYNCQALSTIHLPSGLTTIQAMTFYSCRGIATFEIPESVTAIGNSAFEDCRGLTSVTIPSHVISIGYDAFSSCMYLQDVTIPASVSSIGERAFASCDMLATIYTDFGNTSRLRVMLDSADWWGELDNVTIIEIEEQESSKMGSEENPWMIGSPIVASVMAWTNDLGQLTVGGLGVVSNFASMAETPWAGCATEIVKLQKGEGVTGLETLMATLPALQNVNGLTLTEFDGAAVGVLKVAGFSAVEIKDGLAKLSVVISKTVTLDSAQVDWQAISTNEISVSADTQTGFFKVDTCAQ